MKKIDKKVNNKVNLKFKVGDTVKDPYGDVYHITKITNDSYKTDDGRFILFENQEVYTLSNLTICSEEDEYRMNKLISYFKTIESFSVASWLKSLKDRVQSNK